MADGYDSQMGARKIMRGVRGMINELYLDDLRHKTHRGQSGQFERGFIAGGASYGYDILKTDAGSRYVVNTEQANHVRLIFRKYAVDGLSAQRIVHELNACGVPSPRRGSWSVGSLYGSPNKGSGILNNELYIGRQIWNRSQWLKDPDTGKRQRVDRPRSEWKIIEHPELRIIDEETWRAVRERLDAARATLSKGRGRPARTLFGGMMRCPSCGGAIVAIDKRFYGCAARHDRGPAICLGIRFPREQTDTRLLAELRDELLSPSARRRIEQRLRAAIAEQSKSTKDAGAQLRKRRDELDSEIARLVDALAQIGSSDAVLARLRAAEEERRKLTVFPAQQSKKPDSVERVMALLNERLINLKDSLGVDVERARRNVALLFGDIQIVADENGVYAEFESAAHRLLASMGAASTNGVAGTGVDICRRRVLLHSRSQ